MKYLMLFFLLVMTATGQAQSPSLSLYGGPSYTITSAPPNLWGDTDYLFVNDSIRLRIFNVKEVSYKIRDKLGFDFGVDLYFPVSKKWSISTGLGVSLVRYNLDRVFNDNIISNSISDSLFLMVSDTVIRPIERISELPSSDGNDGCDVLIEEEFERQVDFSVDHNLIYLQIPFHLNFQFNERWSIQAGVQASALLQAALPFSHRERSIQTETDEMGNDIVTCIDRNERRFDRSGNGFNNLLFSANFGMNYRFKSRWGIAMKYSRTLNNIYAQGATSQTLPVLVSYIDNAQTTMHRASISITYQLWTAPTPPNQILQNQLNNN